MTSTVQQMRSASAIDLQERFGKKKLFFVLAAAQVVLLLCILFFCSIKYEVSDDFSWKWWFPVRILVTRMPT